MRDRLPASIQRFFRAPQGEPGSAPVRRTGRILLAVLAIVAAALVVAGPTTLAAPQTCRACHVPAKAYDEWKTSSHKDVSCQSCHTGRAAVAGVGNSVALVADAARTIVPSRNVADVPDATCLSCHRKVPNDKPFVSNGLRMSHAGLQKAGYRCTECHPQVAHKVSAARDIGVTMSTCARCHNNVNQSGKCELCHVDSDVSQETARRSDPEWSRTHGANWKQLHGMGDLSTCTMCHQPSKCQKCHGVPLPHDDTFIASHGKTALKTRAECLSCHRQSFCDSCHNIEMPHPAGFLAKHPKVAKGLEDPLCQRCHITDNCNECHLKHVHPGGAGK